jgi:hypothetical protein
VGARVSKTRRNERKAEVKDITSENARQRYKGFLESEFNAQDVQDKGEYVLLHKRINLPEKKTIDIIVYSTGTIYVSGSPLIDSNEFATKATRIIQLAQQATVPLEQVRPISIQRAKCIWDFAQKLNLDNEYERMVAIILSDTCNEIILREQMKALQIEGAPLDEGVPEKIQRIKNKGYAVVAEEPIKNLRETRNRIVHYGEVPHKEQAIEGLKIAEQVLKSVLK